VNNRVSIREASADERDEWDRLVTRFDGYRLFHKRAWLESLEACFRGKALYLVCEKEGKVVGCWPGLLVDFFCFRLFASPMAGWQTLSMGPLFDESISGSELVAAAIPVLERRYRVQYIELISSLLDDQGMRDLGFEGVPIPRYVAELMPGQEDEVFKRLKSNARRNIRRANRLGLEVRFEEDESFVAETYDQIRETFLRGGHTVPFGIERVRAYFRHLKASQNLLAVSVYLPQGGENIATGLFAMEGRELYLWQWAHRKEYRWYRPTELMTWTVMRKAMEANCSSFDLVGRGEFKKKFGVYEDFSYRRWMRSRFRWLMRGRHWAEQCYRWQQSWRGRVEKLLSSRKPGNASSVGR